MATTPDDAESLSSFDGVSKYKALTYSPRERYLRYVLGDKVVDEYPEHVIQLVCGKAYWVTAKDKRMMEEIAGMCARNDDFIYSRMGNRTTFAKLVKSYRGSNRRQKK